jgi:NADH-quinone oxidoreductase subunit L
MFDPLKIETLTVLIPALPLLAAVLTAALGPAVLKKHSHWPAALAGGISCVLSVLLLFSVRANLPQAAHAGDAAAGEASGHQASAGFETVVVLWNWAAVQDALPTPAAALPVVDSAPLSAMLDFEVEVALRSDPLTSIMLAMVTFVSTLVIIYAAGYMHGDRGYWRFFTYVSLFVFSMTMLVSVSNFLLLYVFWEAVGMCSYLLIGFWYEKPEAAAAGKKAFLVNRVGDFGFALGLFLLWTTYGTLNFHDAGGVAGILGETRLSATAAYVGGGTGLAICLLLLLGACGKSAQFPLHVWLPDAMEGPTPVSALIHAATMVTAGVYMVARCTPLFFASYVEPYVAGGWSIDAPSIVAVVGCFTALLAALIALTETDLKRILAYSTISQLGYMFLGLGVGTLAGVTAGMFHLFTHAFFKALLFLGAGSVMHAMGGVIDVRRFSGLRRLLPITFWTFLIGSLALAGIFPFAGFWSKDAIMAAVADRGHHEGGLYQWLYIIALITACLTAFYTFRALFLTFFGRETIPPEAGDHAHESPPSMTWPLGVLAACAVVVGFYFEWTHGFAEFLIGTPVIGYLAERATGPIGEFHMDVAAISTVSAVLGIAVAAFLYLGEQNEVRVLTRLMGPLYRMSHGKFFFDQLYQGLIVWPLAGLAKCSFWIDRWLIDGLVNFCGRLPVWLGSALRNLQTGLIQFYALAMVLGLLVLLVTLIWQNG